jgi:hypothetical protein
MLLFLFALALAIAGVGGYAYYNPGVHDIAIRGYHVAGVPDWVPVALAAGVPLFLFLLHSIYASVRIRRLRRANRRAGVSSAQGSQVGPQQGPKRSWTPGG